MELYNSLTQKKELFEPVGEEVKIYVCGITPYDTTHLGHAFTYISFDTLIRYLNFRGWRVRYVQNLTDIDDDILRKAREVGDDWKSLGEKWSRRFFEDLDALNVLRPTYYVRATESIDKIIEITRQLIARNYAYEHGGNVYFSVNKSLTFGRLSHLSREEMLPIANQRGNNPNDPNKVDPLDFVLWQAMKPDEPAWDSPWGKGRPGWHIECSAMSLNYLGETVDIHGGGGDLIFPHHECEIAQSEHYTGVHPFVRTWMHIGMVYLDGAKMSKSLGNLILARDLLKHYSANAIRLYLLNHHYRQEWAHNPAELQEAAAHAAELEAASAVPAVGSGLPVSFEAEEAAFSRAMEDDLNTPIAVIPLLDLAGRIKEGAGKRDVVAAQGALRRMGAVLGLRLQ
jgi:cysteinyl-tRNA synthetase